MKVFHFDFHFRLTSSALLCARRRRTWDGLPGREPRHPGTESRLWTYASATRCPVLTQRVRHYATICQVGATKTLGAAAT
eukprot:1140461-Rhodomonas_salina.1